MNPPDLNPPASLPAAGPTPSSADPDAATIDGERELVARLRAKDAAAYEQVVRAYAGRLLAVAQRILRNPEDARDAVQDGFLSAFRSFDTFSGEARLSTWLHRVVVNAALMKVRSKKRAPETPIEDLLPTFSDDGHQTQAPVPWKDDVHEALELEERRLLVRRAIDRLPERYRTILILRDIEELDTAETARLLGISDNAAKIRLHRARQALRTLLDPHFSRGLS